MAVLHKCPATQRAGYGQQGVYSVNWREAEPVDFSAERAAEDQANSGHDWRLRAVLSQPQPSDARPLRRAIVADVLAGISSRMEHSSNVLGAKSQLNILSVPKSTKSCCSETKF